jgi:hypothetical protein
MVRDLGRGRLRWQRGSPSAAVAAPMSDASSGWWGAAIGALLAGLPMLVWGERISRWNRRVGRKGWWQVPPESEAESTWWGARYMRILGAVFTTIGLVALIVAVVMS